MNIELLNLPIVVVDVNGDVLQANEASLSLTGYDRREMVGKKIRDLFPELDHKPGKLLSPTKNGEQGSPKTLLVNKDGDRISVTLKIYPVGETPPDSENSIILFKPETEDKTPSFSQVEQLHLLISLLNNIPMPVYYKDLDLEYLGCNTAFETFVGKKRDEIIGRTVQDVALGEFADLDRIDRELLNNPGVQMYEGKATGADGVVRDFIFYKATFTDVSEKVIGLVGVMLDVTEKVKAEEALRGMHRDLEIKVEERTSELLEQTRRLQKEIKERKKAEEAVKSERQRLYSLLNFMPAQVYVQDRDCNITFANKLFKQRFGEVEGKKCYEVLLGRHSRCEKCSTMDALESMEPFEHERTSPDGLTHYIYHYPFIESDGSPLILKLGIDVTEQKKFREALEEAEKKYRSIFENSTEGIYQCTRGGAYLSVNPAMARILGYDSPEDLLTTVKDARSQVYRDQERCDLRIRLLEDKGEFNDFECQVKTKDGSLIWVSENAGAVKDERGNILYFQGALKDISERKISEERLAKINECFLNFGPDSDANVEMMIRLCGEMLGASICLLTHLDEGNLRIDKVWTAYDQVGIEDLKGHICLDLIRQGGDEVRYIPGVQQTEYAKVDRALKSLGYKTYLGTVYKDRGTSIGTVCVYYDRDYAPSENDKKILSIISSAIGVETKRKRMKTALRDAEEKFRGIFENAVEGIYQSTQDGQLLSANPSLARILGYDSVRDLITNLDLEEDRFYVESGRRDEFVKALLSEGVISDFESRVRKKDGSIIWISENAHVVKDEDGKLLYFEGTIIEITDRKRFEEQMLHKAYHDELTGLPNRLLFIDRLKSALKRAKRHNENTFTVLFLDMDRFKIVNDSLGHGAGDELLRKISWRLRRCLREVDTVARFGGDEFVILLEETGDLDSAVQVIQRIQQELTAPFDIFRNKVFTSVSIGVVQNVMDYESAEDILRDSDTAMYRAKLTGKGGYEIFDKTMHDQAFSAMRLDMELRRALEQGEFTVFYQPIVSAKDDSLVGIEALARWVHPVRGLLLPGEFIPSAEESGLIIPIDELVLEQACRTLKAYIDEHRNTALFVSVNVSTIQFTREDFPGKVRGILEEVGLEPANLILEIPESGLMESVSSTVQTLEEFKRLGVGVSIEGFGTGYSSLGHLHRLHIDTLKIDRSFIGNLGASEDDSTEIVRAIISLAHSLNIGVVAVGVENQTHNRILNELGCEYRQGFYYQEPVDARLLETVLLKWPDRHS